MPTPNSSPPSSPKADKSKSRHKRHSSSHSSKPPEAPLRPSPNARDVLLLLVASRLLNALVIQTFFQPDEFFQALEPAWELAFGSDAGAWITWEWKNHLRSAIHPAIFAVGYRAAHQLARVLHLDSRLEAELLLAAPKTIQAVIAAFGDYYTWKLSDTVYGSGSFASAAALILTVASPWQWFCSTRTFSNCLEATLTIVALYNWPWHWAVTNEEEDRVQIDDNGMRISDADTAPEHATDETTRLRRALLFAAIATVSRPTNILIWMSLAYVTFLRREKAHWFVKVPFTDQKALVDLETWAWVPSQVELRTFVTEAFVCGSAVLGLSAIIDRLFYQVWTFPPINFLYFNVLQSLAVFYGNNNWHYYLSQGYPLLLTTALPFALMNMYRTLGNGKEISKLPLTSRSILSNLTTISIFVPGVLSIISHKEVRFIYPLLPGLHVLAALPIATFFTPVFEEAIPSSRHAQFYRRMLLGFLLLANLIIALITSTSHNSGLIKITHYLRREFETYYATNPTSPVGRSGPISTNANPQANMTVAFLMPCHSTPWRSHLQYPPTATTPGIDAWALTCEPPLNMNVTEKATYVDEADRFYLDPNVWLKRHMSRHPPEIPIPKLRQNGNGNGHGIRNGNGNGRTSGYWNHQNARSGAGVFAPAARPRRMFEVETGIEESLWRDRGGKEALA